MDWKGSVYGHRAAQVVRRLAASSVSSIAAQLRPTVPVNEDLHTLHRTEHGYDERPRHGVESMQGVALP